MQINPFVRAGGAINSNQKRFLSQQVSEKKDREILRQGTIDYSFISPKKPYITGKTPLHTDKKFQMFHSIEDRIENA